MYSHPGLLDAIPNPTGRGKHDAVLCKAVVSLPWLQFVSSSSCPSEQPLSIPTEG